MNKKEKKQKPEEKPEKEQYRPLKKEQVKVALEVIKVLNKLDYSKSNTWFVKFYQHSGFFWNRERGYNIDVKIPPGGIFMTAIIYKIEKNTILIETEYSDHIIMNFKEKINWEKVFY